MCFFYFLLFFALFTVGLHCCLNPGINIKDLLLYSNYIMHVTKQNFVDVYYIEQSLCRCITLK
jgi:hypothetical protein